LEKDGVLYIGLRGVDATGLVKTAAPVRYRVEKGSPRGNGTTAEPTPDVYQQLLVKSGNAEIAAEEAKETSASAEGIAADARTKAENAAITAATAKETADSVASAAASAQTAAGNAATAAAAAQTAAENAQTAAENAQTAAENAQTTAAAALPKNGGTMTGKLIAQNNTDYTTKQVRNMIFVADGDSIPSSSNGDFIVVYEP
jgi:hypothetical protein